MKKIFFLYIFVFQCFIVFAQKINDNALPMYSFVEQSDLLDSVYYFRQGYRPRINTQYTVTPGDEAQNFSFLTIQKYCGSDNNVYYAILHDRTVVHTISLYGMVTTNLSRYETTHPKYCYFLTSDEYNRLVYCIKTQTNKTIKVEAIGCYGETTDGNEIAKHLPSVLANNKKIKLIIGLHEEDGIKYVRFRLPTHEGHVPRPKKAYFQLPVHELQKIYIE